MTETALYCTYVSRGKNGALYMAHRVLRNQQRNISGPGTDLSTDMLFMRYT